MNAEVSTAPPLDAPDGGGGGAGDEPAGDAAPRGRCTILPSASIRRSTFATWISAPDLVMRIALSLTCSGGKGISGTVLVTFTGHTYYRVIRTVLQLTCLQKGGILGMQLFSYRSSAYPSATLLQ